MRKPDGRKGSLNKEEEIEGKEDQGDETGVLLLGGKLTPPEPTPGGQAGKLGGQG